MFITRLCVRFLVGIPMVLVAARNPHLAPVKEAGESVRIEAESGDIVAVSRGLTLRIPKTSGTAPSWDCEIAQARDRLEYRCRMSNGARAARRITVFSMECAHAERLRVSTPGMWMHIAARPVESGFNLHLAHAMADTDAARQLLPNAQTGVFLIESDLLPGLVRIEAGSGAVTEERLADVSPWVLAKVNELDARERHVRTAVGIGPKVLPSEDSMERLWEEVRLAAGAPEFAAWKEDLEKGPAAVALTLSGAEGIVGQFARAMALRLERLRPLVPLEN